MWLVSLVCMPDAIEEAAPASGSPSDRPAAPEGMLLSHVSQET
jgi:hypothetical protein